MIVDNTVPHSIFLDFSKQRLHVIGGHFVICKLLNSAMDNARHQHEDIDAEDMIITHIAAHRGTIKRGFMPRARGRATPKNHYQVNLEVFLEAPDSYDVEDDEF